MAQLVLRVASRLYEAYTNDSTNLGIMYHEDWEIETEAGDQMFDDAIILAAQLMAISARTAPKAGLS
jgi:hypothetical protein